MSEQVTPFRLGVVGCGRIAQAYLDALRGFQDVKLEAAVDTRGEAAQSAAEVWRCRSFESIEQMLDACTIDGAIVCTPPNLHAQGASQLLEAGVPVLCEKPFAIDLEEARAMVASAQQADRVLMMASKFRYVEDMIRAKSIIASGMMGQVHFYRNCFTARVDMRDRWNSNPEVAGGGVLIDNGTHSIDIVRYFLGPIKRIFAFEGRRIAGLPVEDTVTISAITDQDVMARIDLSWSIHIDTPNYVEVDGTEGALRVGWKASRYQHNGHPEWISFGVGYDKVKAFEAQIANFVNTVRGTAEPSINMYDGLHSVAVVKAAYQSLQSGCWVDVQELTDLIPETKSLS